MKYKYLYHQNKILKNRVFKSMPWFLACAYIFTLFGLVNFIFPVPDNVGIHAVQRHEVTAETTRQVVSHNHVKMHLVNQNCYT